jgi:hypothetical protein
MRERAIAQADDPTAEAVATTGLFLIFTAIIGIALCLASWGAANASLAAVSGVIASFSFAASLICFGMQSRDQ